MKLSEMTVDQLTDCLCEIAAPVGNITSDPDIVALLKEFAAKGKAAKAKEDTPDAEKKEEKADITMVELVGGVLAKAVPLMFKKHKNDTLRIIAALNGKTVREIERENGIAVIKMLKSSFDKELLDFFTSSKPTEKTEPLQS